MAPSNGGAFFLVAHCKSMRKLIAFGMLALATLGFAQETVTNATTLWLNQPSAIYYGGVHHRTYLGWVDNAGRVMVGAYDHDTAQFLPAVQVHQWPVSDDHAAPAIHVIQHGPDAGKIFLAYSLHNSVLYSRKSANAENISSWAPEKAITTRKSTYPKLAETSNGTMYVMFRGDALPPLSGQSQGVLKSSTDGGNTWSADTDVVNFGAQMITYPGSLRSFGNRLHILFNVPPLGGTTRTVYHAWRDEAGVWRRASGQALTLPITAASMPPIYTGPEGRNLVLGDLRLDLLGRPIATFLTSGAYTSTFGAACPAYRARFTGSYWQVKAVPSAVQVYYPAGLTIDPNDTNRLVSVVRFNGQYELRSYTTVNDGTTWTPTTLVRQSQAMTRPLFVENGVFGFRLTWLDVTRYVTYRDFLTNLRLGF